MSSIDSTQPSNWLQQVSSSVRQALDTNSDGQIGSAEVIGFLEQLLTVVKNQPNATYDSASGAPIVTKPTAPVLELSTTASDGTGTSIGDAAKAGDAASGTWRDYVLGVSGSSNSRVIPAGYEAGPFRHQLEGFSRAKFDPAHPEGMTLKMIAARVFEQFDVYSDTAIDDVIQVFNELGIPAQKVGIDRIDFGHGFEPIDVIRNKAYLHGDESAGMAWQFPPLDNGDIMNFTIDGVGSPTVAGGTGATATSQGVTAGGSVAGTGVATGTGGVTAAGLYPGSADQLDLDAVEWLHRDVSNWPITSKITDVEIGSDSITIDHTKAGQWPAQDGIEGNPWVFVNRNGQWYGATYEWLRSGQVTKSISADDIGPHTKVEPLASWRPQPGEQVGFMVSTPARTGETTVTERSNVVLTNWPA